MEAGWTRHRAVQCLYCVWCVLGFTYSFVITCCFDRSDTLKVVYIFYNIFTPHKNATWAGLRWLISFMSTANDTSASWCVPPTSQHYSPFSRWALSRARYSMLRHLGTFWPKTTYDRERMRSNQLRDGTSVYFSACVFNRTSWPHFIFIHTGPESCLTKKDT